MGGAVLLGAAGAATGAKLVQERQGSAAIVLNNLLVDTEDLETLTPDDFDAISQRYGVKLAEKLSEDVKGLYGQYLENQIPLGDAPLS